MTGIIIINPYKVPQQSVSQAERLKEEFTKLGVFAEIVSDGYARVFVDEKGVRLDEKFSESDFFVDLDKDKYLSAALEEGGKRVFDSHKVIRLCDDKGDTYVRLAAGGFPVTKTVFAPLCYSENLKTPRGFIDLAEAELGYPVIIKESYGSMGKGVYKAETREELTAIQEKLKTVPHVLQRYEGARRGTDMRVIVVGGKAAAAMLRINETDFRSNIALGGKGVKVDIENCDEYSAFTDMAERAAKYLEADYCGVDLLFSKDGSPIICEVNSNAFFCGIEKVTGVNVASLYARHIVNTVKAELCLSQER